MHLVADALQRNVDPGSLNIVLGVCFRAAATVAAAVAPRVARPPLGSALFAGLAAGQFRLPLSFLVGYRLFAVGAALQRDKAACVPERALAWAGLC